MNRSQDILTRLMSAQLPKLQLEGAQQRGDLRGKDKSTGAWPGACGRGDWRSSEQRARGRRAGLQGNRTLLGAGSPARATGRLRCVGRTVGGARAVREPVRWCEHSRPWCGPAAGAWAGSRGSGARRVALSRGGGVGVPELRASAVGTCAWDPRPRAWPAVLPERARRGFGSRFGTSLGGCGCGVGWGPCPRTGSAALAGWLPRPRGKGEPAVCCSLRQLASEGLPPTRGLN
ncbi:hypothetical protein HPG69_003242 [Diceros bicornis minor]|uniref:Uncharacterized protein n=1 Tax=Diceros bicornis minor TaxID=77932 RepID=A0A7J7FAZ7_DICBM|nr:hypothetical protein HPG69_003242 [Diceros bicornis minor]